jgi:hypothetical protein
VSTSVTAQQPTWPLLVTVVAMGAPCNTNRAHGNTSPPNPPITPYSNDFSRSICGCVTPFTGSVAKP